MANIRQTNFLGGELAPALWGRNDFSLYGKGARTLLNFFVNPQGSAVSRPGTRYVRNGTFSAYSGRLFPFVYSDSVAFVLMASTIDGMVAVSFDKSTGVATSASVTGAGVFAGVSDLNEIQYAQVGATIVFTHPTMTGGPKQLVYDGATWTFGNLDLSYPTLVWRSIPLGNQDTGAPFIVENIAGTFTAPWLPGATAAVNTAPFTATATEPLVDWVYAVSAVIKDSATGALVETRPYVVVNKANGVGGAAAAFPANARIAVSKTKPVYLMRYAPAGGVVSAPNIVTYNYYKGRAGLFGFIGASTDLQFVDDGIEPDFNQQPLRPTAVSPWQLDSSGAVLDYPSAVCHFEGRRAFGGGSKRPGTLLISASGDYPNLDDYTLPWHGEPLKLDLASLKRERMRALVGHSQLLAFTDTSVWAVGGSAGAALDYDTMSARLIDQVGSRSLQPLVVGGHVLYARSKGAGARMLTADFNSPSGGYKVADVTQHALHLFSGNYLDPSTARTKALRWWAYAEDPFGLVWATRGDGTLLIGTPIGDSVAWTRNTPAPFTSDAAAAALWNGFFSVCSIPEGDEDVVYAIVQRWNGSGLNRTLERFESRVIHDNNDDVACLDCAVKVTTSGLSGVISGLPAILDGASVWAVGRKNPALGPVTVSGGVADFTGLLLSTINPSTGLSYTDFIENNGAGEAELFIGLAFTCDIETLDPVSTDTRTRQRTISKVGFEVDNAIGLYVGPNSSSLVEAVPGSLATAYNGTSLDQVVAYSFVQSSWQNGRGFLRQTLPLPVTILGVTREVDFGG